MARNLTASDNIGLIPFQHGTPCVIGGNTVVVMQSILPCRAFPELSIEPTSPVLLWHLFPGNLFHVIAPFRGLRELALSRPTIYRLVMKWLHRKLHRGIIDYVRTLNERKGIVYYDRSTIDVTSSVLGIDIQDPVLVPVPIEVPEEPAKHTAPASRSLVVTWVGRLCDFKIHILVHTIRRFSRMATECGIDVEFEVIGEGPDASRLDGLNVESPRFKLRRLGVMPVQALKNHLLTSVDVVTAMGQSALESARLGVPTILLDFSYRDIQQLYRFRWLDQTVDGDLGHLISSADIESTDSLPEMIEALLVDYRSQVRRSHDYCRRKHDLATVGRAFYAAATNSRMTMQHVPAEVIHRGLIRRIYDRVKYGWQ
jgi:hypothetical protein